MRKRPALFFCAGPTHDPRAMYSWGFIYTLDDPSMVTRVDTIGALTCVGVATVEDAPAEALKLVAQGAKLIELCGGFGAAGLAQVQLAVGADVAVGAVFFGCDAMPALQKILPVPQALAKSAAR